MGPGGCFLRLREVHSGSSFRAKAVLFKGQQALVPHLAQLLGEGAAVQIEVVGQLLPVERDLELQTAAAGGLCGKVGQQTAPHGLGGGAEDALRKAQVFAHGHREQVAQQLFVHRAGCAAGKGGNVHEQHFALFGGHGVHHHHVAAQRVGLGKGLPGRNAAQDALTAPQVEIFDVDGAAQHHAQSMHLLSGMKNDGVPGVALRAQAAGLLQCSPLLCRQALKQRGCNGSHKKKPHFRGYNNRRSALIIVYSKHKHKEAFL